MKDVHQVRRGGVPRDDRGRCPDGAPHCVGWPPAAPTAHPEAHGELDRGLAGGLSAQFQGPSDARAWQALQA